MDEKTALKIILSDSKVRRASLLAEHLATIDNYLSMSEEDLISINWVDKKGKNVPMVPMDQINKLVTKREIILHDHEGEERDFIIRSAKELELQPLLKNVLSNFTTSRKASKVALVLSKLDSLEPTGGLESIVGDLSAEEKQDFLDCIDQCEKKAHKSYISISDDADKIICFLLMLINIRTGIDYNKDETRNLTKDVMKNWSIIIDNPKYLEEIYANNIREIRDQDVMRIIERVSKIFNLGERNRKIALLFIKEILKMVKNVPDMAENAISTGNPFLFRSLFLDFKEAKEFAVGGKLNSSLETKYGNLFEELMLIFHNGRGVRDGGIDIVVNNESFDVKSGPNVMNKSQVDAFSSKQRLIQDENILPSIDTYKIALGYGRRERLNSFMAMIDSDILVGREAWEILTGNKYAPEIVFAVAGFVAKIFNSDSVVASMLNQDNKYTPNQEDHDRFHDLFYESFSDIDLPNEVIDEVEMINNLI